MNYTNFGEFERQAYDMDSCLKDLLNYWKDSVSTSYRRFNDKIFEILLEINSEFCKIVDSFDEAIAKYDDVLIEEEVNRLKIRLEMV